MIKDKSTSAFDYVKKVTNNPFHILSVSDRAIQVLLTMYDIKEIRGLTSKQDDRGYMALHHTCNCSSPNLEGVNRLIERGGGKELLFTHDNHRRRTALHVACDKSNTVAQILKRLNFRLKKE